MNKLLSQRRLREIRRKRCPYYEPLVRWFDGYDEASSGRYHLIAASNCLVHPISEWHQGHREQHDPDAVAEHAFLTNHLLRELGLWGWLAQLKHDNWPWFGPHKRRVVNAARIAYLGSFAVRGKLDVLTFCGGFLIDQFPTSFVNLFMDYAVVNETCDVDLINLEKPVMLRLSHHLTADLITSDRSMFDRAVAFYDRSDLRQIQQNPHVYVNASLDPKKFFGVETMPQ